MTTAKVAMTTTTKVEMGMLDDCTYSNHPLIHTYTDARARTHTRTNAQRHLHAHTYTRAHTLGCVVPAFSLGLYNYAALRAMGKSRSGVNIPT